MKNMGSGCLRSIFFWEHELVGTLWLQSLERLLFSDSSVNLICWRMKKKWEKKGNVQLFFLQHRVATAFFAKMCKEETILFQ